VKARGNHINSAGHKFISRKQSYVQLVLPWGQELAESILQCNSCVEMENSFSWDDFALAVENWKQYTSELRRQLCAFMPSWLTYQSIYYIDESEINECDR
jgi:hypothetical protein